MEIKRDFYLSKLIKRMDNGLIKIVTGVRRCGKSFLLLNLFYRHLLNHGVPEDHIIRIPLDDKKNQDLLDIDHLDSFVRRSIVDSEKYYLILDEIQMVQNFESLLNGFLHIKNLDTYVTGSNSKFLSSDVVTEFRGRGDEIRIYPLTFQEVLSGCSRDKYEAWRLYCLYGGMPQVVVTDDESGKQDMLRQLFSNVYLNDIVERYNLRWCEPLERLVDVLASDIGSLTNPLKLSRTFRSMGGHSVSNVTIEKYISCLKDSFLISKVERFDIKGKQYIGSPYKVYFCDAGLRNARLNFRQQEETHLIENIVYNELLVRGYSVDIGAVYSNETIGNGMVTRKQLEVDFVVNNASKRYYVQVAYGVPDMEKFRQETASFMKIRDSFPKILVVMSNIMPWMADNGVKVINIMDFLLDPNSLMV